MPITTAMVRGRFSKKRKLSGELSIAETGCGAIRLDDDLDETFWLSIYLPKELIDKIRNSPPVEGEQDVQLVHGTVQRPMEEAETSDSEVPGV